MLPQFLDRQLDYILFFCGLVFIVLQVVCLDLIRTPKQKLPWGYLVGFAFVQGIYVWTENIILAFGETPFFAFVRVFLIVLSYGSLFEFGRVGLKRINGFNLRRWIHLPLILCLGLGGTVGLSGVNAAARYTYALGGGLLTAFVLFSASRSSKNPALTLAAAVMTLYAVAAGIVVPEASFFPASTINQVTFHQWLGIPIQVIRVGIVVCLAYVIWSYYQKVKPPVLSEDGSRPKNSFEIQFVAAFCALLLAGWIAAEYAANLANKTIYQDLLNHTNLARTAINPTQFSFLSANERDISLPGYQSIRDTLIEIRSAETRLDDVYLMVLKNGRVFFAVDGAPSEDKDFINPGVPYVDPPLELFDVFFSGKTRIVGPYADEYGTYLSGFASIRDQFSGKVIGVLGVDMLSSYVQMTVARYRLVTIAITLLLFLIFIGYFTTREKTWESSQKIAASQSSLAQAQHIARIGSWNWSFLSNHLIWSEEMYHIFGRPTGDPVDSFSDFQEYFTAEEWVVFSKAVQKAILKNQDFELETHVVRPDKTQRMVVTRGKVRTAQNEEVIQVVGITQDVTEQKLADEKVRVLFRAIEQSPISVVITDSAGKIEYVNPKFCSLTGYTLQEAIGQNPRILKSGDTTDEEYAALWEHILTGRQWQGEFHNKKKNGDLYWEAAIISPIQDENGKITHFVAVKEDITERKVATEALHRAHEALAESNRELELASKVKSQFLANMSHEIRTPLNAVIGMTGLLLDTPLNSEQLNYAETVRTSGEVLLSLINDILDFSKIEAQKMELENQAFSLRQCIEEALDLVVTKAAEKKLELAYLIEDELPDFIIGDVTRLRQILVNLLSNAIKFTEKGEVVVSVRGQVRDRRQYQLHISVRDTGLGIPPDRLDRLFQSFSQVDSSMTRRYGGTGLGLAISKRLSEMMGGTMWVESTGIPGQGSTFHFTLLAEETTGEPIDPGKAEPTDLAGLRILIVDDNKTNREILLKYTESWHMAPTAVDSAQAALNLLHNHTLFDVAILDLQMPEMDGLTLAKEIQSLQIDRNLPLILLSSLGYREAQGEETLFSAYLTKPIKPSLLFDSLGTSLNRKSPAVKKKYNAPLAALNPEMGSQHPLRILVVDDNAVNQNVALSLLGKIGYRADVVSSGAEAISTLTQVPYDVVFMDGQMPEMDGEEATRRIRQLLPVEMQPRIIAMTANAMQGDRERYLACGMDDYVSKPIRIEELVRALSASHPTQRDPAGAPEGDPDLTSLATAAPDGLSIQPAGVAAVTQPEVDTNKNRQAVEPSVLREFQELMGEDGLAMVADLVRLFLGDCPELIDKMHQALTASDNESLRRQAHTLKGNCNQIGALPLAAVAAELELLAKNGSNAGAETLIAQIEAEYQCVRANLQSYVNIPNP